MFSTGKHTLAATSRTSRAAVLARVRQEPDAGFTLIEAIVSFTIFAIVILGAVLAIVAGQSSANSSRDRVTAANVAQQEIARAQALPTASLTAAPTATSTSTVGAEPYTVTRKVDFSASATASPQPAQPTACPSVITAGTAYWMHVAVTVTWPGSNGRSVQMDTVRAC